VAAALDMADRFGPRQAQGPVAQDPSGFLGDRALDNRLRL